MWVGHTDKQIDQKNNLKGSKIDLHLFSYLVFDKNSKIIQREMKAFWANGAGINIYSHENKLWPLTRTIHKN